MVEQYKNILVAVDGSEQSYDALREAIEIAQANDSQLKILYVLNDKLANIPVHLDTMTLYKSVQEHSDYVVDQVQGYLKDTEVSFEIVRLTGSPKREIINYSKENNIDLIVLGSTGLDAIDRFIIGLTVQDIVNHGSWKVWVVK